IKDPFLGGGAPPWHVLCWGSVNVAHKPSAAGPGSEPLPSLLSEPLVATPCWQAEDFVVVQDCAPCTIFQAKTMPECSTTGFIEQVSCAVSKKEEYKGNCRSVVTEAHSFWKFEGAMICVAVVFALLVMCRQRVLDRKALEKVLKQIESI
uniref:Protein JTB n=1 Tax=Gopherus evgoodei TaxID=1825980 RepID=A0A8C4Y8L7_9SAUR